VEQRCHAGLETGESFISPSIGEFQLFQSSCFNQPLDLVDQI
jgi:hypothetical protein